MLARDCTLWIYDLRSQISDLGINQVTLLRSNRLGAGMPSIE